MSRRYSKYSRRPLGLSFRVMMGRLPEKRGHRPANMPIANAIAYSSIVHGPRYAVNTSDIRVDLL